MFYAPLVLRLYASKHLCQYTPHFKLRPLAGWSPLRKPLIYSVISYGDTVFDLRLLNLAHFSGTQLGLRGGLGSGPLAVWCTMREKKWLSTVTVPCVSLLCTQTNQTLGALRSSGILSAIDWQLVTKVSGQNIGPMLKNEAVQD